VPGEIAFARTFLSIWNLSDPKLLQQSLFVASPFRSHIPIRTIAWIFGIIRQMRDEKPSTQIWFGVDAVGNEKGEAQVAFSPRNVG
jgi:hypothetical protein